MLGRLVRYRVPAEYGYEAISLVDVPSAMDTDIATNRVFHVFVESAGCTDFL